MNRQRALKLVVCIDEESLRLRFLRLITVLIASGKLEVLVPNFKIELSRCTSKQAALDSLRQHLSAADDRAAIVISDALTENVADPTQSDSWMPSYWAKDVRDEFPRNLVTLGIMNSPRRVRDIDRVIGRSAKGQAVLDALKLLADKLTYTSRPEKRVLTQPIEIRLIRRQTELMEYFKLRHRIYKIMGYLEDDIEDAPSQMEINWCDTISLHVGAYEQLRNQRERLVGTARVVIGTSEGTQERCSLLSSYEEWTTRLASQDEILRNVLANRVLGLELPIFHSLNLFEIFREIVLHNQVCGELSRVIVAEDFRGAGLSRRLAEFALAEAAKVGVNRMFLECLDIHEDMYRRLGFTRLKGVSGAVISVNQTMIGMEMNPLVAGPVEVTPAAGNSA